LNALGLHQKEKETLALLSEENVRKNLAPAMDKPWMIFRAISGRRAGVTMPRRRPN
jgi:hypothetical protein